MTDERVEEAAAYLASRGFDGRFSLAIILGTGLGDLADALDEPVSTAYAGIPHFPKGGVSGHAGRLVAGRLEGRRVLLLQGRVHYYETGDPAAMRVPIGVVRALSAPPLLLTNASGSTDPTLRPGSLVALSDHINFSGLNPLIGHRDEAVFVTMTDAYDPDLLHHLTVAAETAGVSLRQGVYLWFSGPSFETPAEIRMARSLGADLVGMSTVPEVILARYAGLKVAAVSVVTNLAAGIEGAAPSHGETKDVARHAAADLTLLTRALLSELDHG